jgi:hypothetical protein
VNHLVYHRRLKILRGTAFRLVVLASGPVSCEIIPPGRICDWTPGVNVGVPGGIPHRAVIGSTGNAAAYGTGAVGSDGYFGSTSHTTIARNCFTATHPSATENLVAVNIGRWNNYFSLMGNC